MRLAFHRSYRYVHTTKWKQTARTEQAVMVRWSRRSGQAVGETINELFAQKGCLHMKAPQLSRADEFLARSSIRVRTPICGTFTRLCHFPSRGDFAASQCPISFVYKAKQQTSIVTGTNRGEFSQRTAGEWLGSRTGTQRVLPVSFRKYSADIDLARKFSFALRWRL